MPRPKKYEPIRFIWRLYFLSSENHIDRPIKGATQILNGANPSEAMVPAKKNEI